MKKLSIYLIMILLIVSSCASSKTFQINDQSVDVKPYGWANKKARHNENVIYEVSLGNVVWSIIGVETVVIPVWLTGWQLYQPVRLKDIPVNKDNR